MMNSAPAVVGASDGLAAFSRSSRKGTRSCLGAGCGAAFQRACSLRITAWMPTLRDRATNKNLPYDVRQLGASGASTLKRGTRGSWPQAAHGPAAEASSSAASSSSVVGGGGGDGS
mgnify:CR=1 FL=1